MSDLPPLPPYTLSPRPPLLPFMSDNALTFLLPVVAYWAFSMLFHLVDVYDLLPQYRLHTPAEVLKRNKPSRRDVVRDVLVQQVVQTLFGAALTLLDEPDLVGKDEHNLAAWALRLRVAQRYVPTALGLVGVDARALALRVAESSPTTAAILLGGRYALTSTTREGLVVPAFAAWEVAAAQLIYHLVVPALQFLFAIVWVDTWQYFIHRAMHMNKWLYTTIHSRHHRLYVPYAYGALYNHPVEGLFLDTAGAGLAYLFAGMSPRQGMWFFTCSTIKTVDDHSGYALPWDPLQHITANNAGYHDVHHQSWGIKTNFSQPFFTFWDRALGTVWTGGDVSARYERARLAAERGTARDGGAPTSTSKPRSASITGSHPMDSVLDGVAPYDRDAAAAAPAFGILDTDTHSRITPSVPAGKASAQALASREQVLQDVAGGGVGVIAEEMAEEADAKTYLRRGGPRKRSSTQSGSGSLKGLRERVATSGAFHGRTGGLLGYESTG